MLFKTIRYNNSDDENVFPGAHCKGNLRLLSETSIRVNSHCSTFFMDYIHWFSSKRKNCKI